MDPNKLTRCIAMDCEMVGKGKNWRQDMLARVSLVNEVGICLYDKYVKPTHPVTDYRTHVSGIRKQNLDDGEDIEVVRRQVQDYLRGRILVGHSLENDLGLLKITHPEEDVRDTGYYFEKLLNTRTPALKWLAKRYLGETIQDGEHSSIEDARTSMKIYKRCEEKWEASLV